MTIWQTIIFSVIEAITEFWPVSSTAQLLLAGRLWPVSDTGLFANFAVFIQLGAVLAVVFVFWKSVWQHKNLWGKFLLAVVPTAAIGLLLHGVVKKYLQDSSILTGFMLIIFGLIFSLLDLYYSKKRGETHLTITDEQLTTQYIEEVEKQPWYKMVGIGIGQSLALISGVSRSGASIYTARALGFSKLAATALSFVIAVPTIAGATLLDMKDIFLSDHHFVMPAGNDLLIYSLGFMATLVISLFVCKKLIKWLASKPFWYFGIYRVIVGIWWILLFLK